MTTTNLDYSKMTPLELYTETCNLVGQERWDVYDEYGKQSALNLMYSNLGNLIVAEEHIELAVDKVMYLAWEEGHSSGEMLLYVDKFIEELFLRKV